MTEEEAREWIAERWGSEGVDKLGRFAESLLSANTRQNLIARSSTEHVWSRHFVDSAQLLEYTCEAARDTRVLDIGSGAGFPGLVIALLEPNKRVHLVEPRAARVKWLQSVVDEFLLQNCIVHECKVDRLPPFEVDLITARAVASLQKLIAWGAPFSTKHTTWLLPKGKGAWQELEQATRPVREMFHVEHSITDLNSGILIGKGRAKVKL